jgi:hypothetical protein
MEEKPMSAPTRRAPGLLVVSGAMLALILACSGATHNENEAGADVWMEGDFPYDDDDPSDGFCQFNGSIAADDRSSAAFVLLTWDWVDCAEWDIFGDHAKTILRVEESEDEALPVLDLSRHDDVRVLFPEDGLLIMGESLGREYLYLFDINGENQRDATSVDAIYNGTRLSSSGRWVAVADNAVHPNPIQVIDTRDLSVTQVSEAGAPVEAMWLETTDVLAIVTEPPSDAGVTLALWSPETPDESIFEETMPGYHFDESIDYTWIGVHPRDAIVVFPVEHETRGDELLVLDTTTGQVDRIGNANGPVGFSPEGDLIVAYRFADEDGDGYGDEGGWPSLLLIDVATLEEQELEIPFEGYPEYFVTHEGRVVVVASIFGDQDLVLFDLDSGEMTEVGAPSLGLEEFVSRAGHGELWLVDEPSLYRLDLETAVLELVPLNFGTSHINILPTDDRLVLDETGRTTLRFFDPDARVVTQTVNIDARLAASHQIPRPVPPAVPRR